MPPGCAVAGAGRRRPAGAGSHGRSRTWGGVAAGWACPCRSGVGPPGAAGRHDLPGPGCQERQAGGRRPWAPGLRGQAAAREPSAVVAAGRAGAAGAAAGGGGMAGRGGGGGMGRRARSDRGWSRSGCSLALPLVTRRCGASLGVGEATRVEGAAGATGGGGGMRRAPAGVAGVPGRAPPWSPGAGAGVGAAGSAARVGAGGAGSGSASSTIGSRGDLRRRPCAGRDRLGRRRCSTSGCARRCPAPRTGRASPCW